MITDYKDYAIAKCKRLQLHIGPSNIMMLMSLLALFDHIS